MARASPPALGVSHRSMQPLLLPRTGGLWGSGHGRVTMPAGREWQASPPLCQAGPRGLGRGGEGPWQAGRVSRGAAPNEALEATGHSAHLVATGGAQVWPAPHRERYCDTRSRVLLLNTTNKT